MRVASELVKQQQVLDFYHGDLRIDIRTTVTTPRITLEELVVLYDTRQGMHECQVNTNAKSSEQVVMRINVDLKCI
jgi:hypothetical protein